MVEGTLRDPRPPENSVVDGVACGSLGREVEEESDGLVVVCDESSRGGCGGRFAV